MSPGIVSFLGYFAIASGAWRTSGVNQFGSPLRQKYSYIEGAGGFCELKTAGNQPINDTGYRVGYAIAEDNLRLGRTVIADSVNPIQLTRDAWIGVAHRAQVGAAEVEVICSGPQQHRQRVETRPADISGLRLPTWEEVVSREYEPWERKHIVIDTTGRSVAESVKELREALPK